MEMIRADNVDQALVRGLTLLDDLGVREHTRNGGALVMPCPVMTVNSRPMHRVSFSPIRDANPFFHLMEALWMLAGRNDATWLDQFVGDFSKRFAEEDGTMHAAYGFRWRCHFDVEGGGPEEMDQLEKVVRLLKANPLDRRVVIAMWDPMADLGRSYKDVPCNTHTYPRLRKVTDDPMYNSTVSDPITHYELDLTVCCRSNDAIWGCLAGDTLVQSPEGDIPISSLTRRFKLGMRRFPVYAVNPATGQMGIKWCTKAWKTGVKPVRELVFDDGTTLRLTGNHRLYLRKTRRGKVSTPEGCIVETTAQELRVGDRIWAPRLLNYGNYLEFKSNILKGTDYGNRRKVHLDYDELLRGLRPEGIEVHHADECSDNNRSSNLERLTKSEHMSLHMIERLQNLSPAERKTWAKRGSLAAAVAVERMSPEETAELSRLRAKAGRENMIKYHARLSPEERSIRARKASEAARLVDTPEKAQQRGVAGSASRWSEPDQHRKQSELMKRLNREGRLRPNHKIVAINELPPESVYDFTVENFHTALVGNGVLVHNCHGSNAVHFSVLQEYLAARVGVQMGMLYQLSNNYHAYDSERSKFWPGLKSETYSDYDRIRPTNLVDDPEHFDDDLKLFFSDNWNRSWVYPYFNPFFARVACPMRMAYAYWRAGRHHDARQLMKETYPCDWQIAAVNWFERRAMRAAGLVRK